MINGIKPPKHGFKTEKSDSKGTNATKLKQKNVAIQGFDKIILGLGIVRNVDIMECIPKSRQ